MIRRNKWRTSLPAHLNNEINELIRRVAVYREAYKKSSDVKIAQLFCIVAELNKDIKFINKRLAEIERDVKNIKRILLKIAEAFREK